MVREKKESDFGTFGTLRQSLYMNSNHSNKRLFSSSSHGVYLLLLASFNL